MLKRSLYRSRIYSSSRLVETLSPWLSCHTTIEARNMWLLSFSSFLLAVIIDQNSIFLNAWFNRAGRSWRLYRPPDSREFIELLHGKRQDQIGHQRATAQFGSCEMCKINIISTVHLSELVPAMPCHACPMSQGTSTWKIELYSKFENRSVVPPQNERKMGNIEKNPESLSMINPMDARDVVVV